jgi:hypothetical protein
MILQALYVPHPPLSACCIYVAPSVVFHVCACPTPSSISRYHFLMPELGFFDATLTGDVTSRLVADTSQLGDQIALNLNIFLRWCIPPTPPPQPPSTPLQLSLSAAVSPGSPTDLSSYTFPWSSALNHHVSLLTHLLVCGWVGCAVPACPVRTHVPTVSGCLRAMLAGP